MTRPRSRALPRGLAVLCGLAASVAAAAGGVPAGFHTGADISLLARLEQLGAVFRVAGQPEDVLQTFKDHGCTMMRLRLWVNPGGEDIFVNDLAYTAALGRRIKDAGLLFLLDIHYADSWADPEKQPKPAAWAGLPFDRLTAQVRTYTRDVVATLRDAGAMPDIVQIGNETPDGFLWPDGRITVGGWAPFIALLQAGIAGVHDGTGPAARPAIALHIDRGADWDATLWFFEAIAAHGVEYDIIAQSFYPFYHGPIADARTALTRTAEHFDKPILLVETGYPCAGDTGAGKGMTYPATPAGQREFLIDLVSLVRNLPDGRGVGVLYWEPEWIPVGGLVGSWREKTLYDDSGNLLPGLAALGGLLDPSRTCRIVNAATGTSLATDPSPPEAGPPRSAAGQRWRIVATGDGWFRLSSPDRSRVLAGAGSAGACACVEMAADSGSHSQHWDFVDAGHGEFAIVNRGSGLALAAGVALTCEKPAAADPRQCWRMVDFAPP